MADTTTVREIRAVFTASMADYNRAIQSALGPTQEIRRQIEQVGQTMARLPAQSSRQMRAAGRELATAGRLAGQYGQAAARLAAQERELGRAVEVQTGQLAAQREEYQALADRAGALERLAETLRGATAGLDLSTPLREQRTRAEAEMGRIERAAAQLRGALATARPGRLIELEGGDLLSLEQARARLAQLGEEEVRAADRFQRLGSAIRALGTEGLAFATSKGASELQAEIARTRSRMEALSLQAGQTQSRLLTYGERLEQVRARQSALAGQTEDLSARLRRMRAAATAPGDALRQLGEDLRAVATMAPRALGNLGRWLRGAGQSAAGADGGVQRLLRSIRNLGVVSLGLRGLNLLFGELRSIVSQYLAENQAAAASVQALKSALANALAPAVNIAINALNAILPYIQAVSNAFATLVTNLFGAKWTVLSSGAATASAALDGAAESADGAAAAQERYNRTLASFDEINRLEEPSTGASGGGGGGSPAAGGMTATTIGGGEGVLGQFSAFLEEVARLIQGGEWANLGTYLAESFGRAMDTLYEAITGEAVRGKIFAAVEALTTTANALFARLTLLDEATGGSIAERTGQTLAAAVNLAFETVNRTVGTIRWDQVGLALAQAINGAVAEADFSMIGETIGNVLLILPEILYNTVINVEWDKVTRGLSDALVSALRTLDDFVGRVDWKQIARAIEDALSGIQWGAIGEALLNLLVDVLDGVWQVLTYLVSDGIEWALQTAVEALGNIWEDFVTGLSDGLENALGYFGEKIAQAGGNVGAGILNGILDAFLALDQWVTDHIFRPLLDAFCSVFGIHSPASNPELLEAAGNVGLGILGGIAGSFLSLGAWVSEHILTPLSNAVRSGWQALQDGGAMALEFAVQVANDAADWWDDVQTWWGERVGAVQEFTTGVVNGARGWWSSVQQWWAGRVGSVRNFTTNVANRAATWWSDVRRWWGDKVGAVASFTTGVVNQAATWWSDVRAWWAEKAGAVAGFTTGVVNQATVWWGDVTSWWSSVTRGKSLTATISTVVQKAASVASSLWDWITGKSSGNASASTTTTVNLKKGTWDDQAADLLETAASDRSVTAKVTLKKGSWNSAVASALEQLSDLGRSTSHTLSLAVTRAARWNADAWEAAQMKAGTTSRTLSVAARRGTWLSDAWQAAQMQAGTTIRTLSMRLTKGSWSTDAWRALTSGSAQSTTVSVKLKKSGWSSLNSFVGSYSKTISLKLSWKTSGLSAMQRKMAQILFGSARWPTLRFAARGGIVDRATLLGNTVAGEDGAEAIIPLERHTEWIDRVADRLASRLPAASGDGGPIILNISIGEEHLLTRVIDGVNQITRRTGACPIRV